MWSNLGVRDFRYLERGGLEFDGPWRPVAAPGGEVGEHVPGFVGVEDGEDWASSGCCFRGQAAR